MEIVSISMAKEDLIELNRVQKKFNFRSRSKLLRATINSFLNEYRVMESAKGHTDAVFTITYREMKKHSLSDMLHTFEDCIKTEVHQHHVGVCLEVLIVCAKAERLREMFVLLKREKSVLSVNCSLL